MSTSGTQESQATPNSAPSVTASQSTSRNASRKHSLSASLKSSGFYPSPRTMKAMNTSGTQETQAAVNATTLGESSGAAITLARSVPATSSRRQEASSSRKARPASRSSPVIPWRDRWLGHVRDTGMNRSRPARPPWPGPGPAARVPSPDRHPVRCECRTVRRCRGWRILPARGCRNRCSHRRAPTPIAPVRAWAPVSACVSRSRPCARPHAGWRTDSRPQQATPPSERSPQL